MRTVWLRVHLWLGLTVGALLSVIGLTGSVLVFYTNLDEAFELPVTQHPALRTDTPTYESVVQLLKHTWPDRTRGWRLELPAGASPLVRARYYQPAEKAGKAFAPLLVWVDPGSMRVVHHAFWGDTPMTWLYDLHYTLLMDGVGRLIVGCLGLVALISVGSGLYLWWPRRRNFRVALTVRFNASRQRTTYDLHKIGGVYLLPVVAVLIVTGVLLDMPETFNPVIGRASPLFVPPVCRSTPGPRRISLDEALGVARRRFPDAAPRWLETPDGPQGCYRFRLHRQAEPGSRFPATTVWVDAYTGAVVGARDVTAQSAGDTFVAWLHPLHSGQALGIPGRLVVLVSGLAFPLLFITGILRWRQKGAARQRKANPPVEMQ
ncbi:PepSY-associated TM helix domain-containing protein [Burkholderia ambifaria]|uniref:PepSY-associated TM helix domain-containing protein n=1 Tax=Burkholderia ambifaria TaxID=152480 RepID=UPI00158EEBD5|nr:PepSY-associated TM helix domain-containing protein [Burkholderia ambifaria]